MQLKGLVRFFAIALILICLYQLSFTWFVRNHENKMEERADSWVKANYPTAQAKYPGNKELQELYQDTLETIKQSRLQRMLDSTKNEKIVLGMATYQTAKQKELMLGLDLQGGISVTMEVGIDGMIKALANNTKDPAFNAALGKAVQRKANSGANLITLFREEFTSANPNTPLAPFFAARSGNRIKFTSSDDEVISYLRTQATNAFNNTFDILTTRIDRFGVASPNINKDEAKSIITIELAGAKDPERVRRYLQSTANLQFFELYTLGELDAAIMSAETSLFDYQRGSTPASKADTAAPAAADTNTVKQPGDTNTSGKVSDLAGGGTGIKAGTDKTSSVDSFPIRRLVQFIPPQQDQSTGEVNFSPALGFVRAIDTPVLNSYLNLEFIKNKFPANLVFMYGKADSKELSDQGVMQLYAVKTLANGSAELEGDRITDAVQDYENNKPIIRMTMDQTGTRTWAAMTKRNLKKPIAIVLDNFVHSAPVVQSEIANGVSQISGNYTVIEAQDLARILTSGKLPAPARIVQEQVVGPTLGQEAVEGGMLSFIISFVVIFALMLIYYNTGGWVANIALILNVFFTIGILSALNATLTAAGIAGLVLTIGMAVDTNVVIFERIKEELVRGKSYGLAVRDGYNRSLAPVLDGHITSLLTAIILFYFGLGPVLGFATTQIIGLLLSLFTGILISRLITDWYTKKNRHFEYFTSLSKRIFRHSQYKFIEYRKIAYVISVVILVLGIASFFNGFDQGVEFAGGRSYTVRFDKPQDVEQVRERLENTFGESPVIKTVGGNNTLNITTAYQIEETGPTVDSAVTAKLYEGLQPFLTGVSYAKFVSPQYIQSSQTVLPTISDDLKRGAQYATLLAVFVICLYIFMRFRDWRYSVGTIVALMHDVFVTLIVFSFLRHVVDFPLEIDQHFIAAILTVIGFSMNDTVIVYDRIREDSRLYPTMPTGQLVNRAINETLARTIMTSVTVFLTILILFIFGGEVTRGFAFAMLIGVVTGSYSSIFVAAPILIDFARNKPLGKKTEMK